MSDPLRVGARAISFIQDTLTQAFTKNETLSKLVSAVFSKVFGTSVSNKSNPPVTPQKPMPAPNGKAETLHKQAALASSSLQATTTSTKITGHATESAPKPKLSYEQLKEKLLPFGNGDRGQLEKIRTVEDLENLQEHVDSMKKLVGQGVWTKTLDALGTKIAT